MVRGLKMIVHFDATPQILYVNLRLLEIESFYVRSTPTAIKNLIDGQFNMFAHVPRRR